MLESRASIKRRGRKKKRSYKSYVFVFFLTVTSLFGWKTVEGNNRNSVVNKYANAVWF